MRTSAHHHCDAEHCMHWAQVGSDYCIYHADRHHRDLVAPSPSDVLSASMKRSDSGWRHGVGSAGDVISWKRPL